jgi:predicted DNA-binding protein
VRTGFSAPTTLQWLEDHGIEPHEVMQALYNTRRWPRPALTAEGRQVLSVWGSTNKRSQAHRRASGNGRRIRLVDRECPRHDRGRGGCPRQALGRTIMSDDGTFPGEDQLRAGTLDLTYLDDTEQSEEDLLATLPPPPQDVDDTLVVTSLRLPLAIQRQLKAYAEQRGVAPSVLIRQWIEVHLAAADKQISLDDAVRALASLPRAA